MQAGAGTANAQLIDERIQLENPVRDRVPQDFINPGLAFKGFQYRPKLTIQGRYDSNVLAVERDKRSDLSVTVEPELNVVKRHGDSILTLKAKAEIERFANESDENSEDFEIFSQGRIEPNSDWHFPYTLSYNHRSRDRTESLANQTTTDRLTIDTLTAFGGVTRNFNRFSLSLLGTYEDIDNEDGVSIFTGAPVVYSDGDRVDVEGRVRARYEFPRGRDTKTEEHILFADAYIARSDYARRQFQGGAFTGVQGDRDIYGISAGFQTDYKGILFANIAGGYEMQDFDEPELDNTDAYTFAANVSYNITPKLTLRLDGYRGISQDNGYLRGVVETNTRVSADYELLHDWYLSSYIGYNQSDYTDIERSDDDFIANIGAKHYLSRRLSAEIEGRYFDRDSTFDQLSFDRYELMLRVNGEL